MASAGHFGVWFKTVHFTLLAAAALSTRFGYGRPAFLALALAAVF